MNSPGFISREWIETGASNITDIAELDSPGFISREWIETLAISSATSG